MLPVNTMFTLITHAFCVLYGDFSQDTLPILTSATYLRTTCIFSLPKDTLYFLTAGGHPVFSHFLWPVWGHPTYFLTARDLRTPSIFSHYPWPEDTLYIFFLPVSCLRMPFIFSHCLWAALGHPVYFLTARDLRTPCIFSHCRWL